MKRPLIIARQAARPSGLLGALLGLVMRFETARDNDQALDLLDVRPQDWLLEIGFGPGRALGAAACRAHRGFVAGIDASPAMCESAARRNRSLLEHGRMALTHGDVIAGLPYPDRSFDKAWTVHSIYFWDDLGAALREIHRVLRPGGTLLIGFRFDPGAQADFPGDVYRWRSRDVVEEAVAASGFMDVRTSVDASPKRVMHWLRASRSVS